MKLLFITQVYENYGGHEWDGEGECPQYWKAKGSCDYVVKNFKTLDACAGVVDAIISKIERNNEYLYEYVIDWKIVDDDYLTSFEKDQLDYQGRIDYSPKELTL